MTQLQFFQCESSCSKGTESIAALPFKTDQQWCLCEIKQSDDQHVTHRRALHHVGLSEFEVCARVDLQAWLFQNKQATHTDY